MARHYERVAVIGAGLMGHALALAYALGGHQVWLQDAAESRLADAKERARLTAQPLIANGATTPAAVQAALQRVTLAAELAEAVRQAEFVVEAVAEDLAIKRAVFAELDRLAPPSTVLASNSSALGPDALAEVTGRPTRVLVTHWFNPPTLLPLVEVVRGRSTGDDVVQAVVADLAALGKRPVVVPRYTPGFAANRLQAAMVRECTALVDEGLLSPAEVDDVLRFSLAPRWAALGCLRIVDFGNVQLFDTAMRTIFPHLSNAAEPGPVLAGLAAAGHHGVTTGHGFYDWTPEAIAEQRELRDSVIQAVLARTHPVPSADDQ